MSDTLLGLFKKAKNRDSSLTAVQFKKQNQWIKYNWMEYFQEVEKVASGLASLGVTKGDRVAIMSNTRIDWALSDLAIMGLGAQTIPIYQSNRPEEVEFILNNSEATIFIGEDKEVFDKFKSVQDSCKTIQKVILFDEYDGMDEDVVAFENLKIDGVNYNSSNSGHFDQAIDAIEPQDIATIIYTSGTTGLPKGVVLTHAQFMSETEAFDMVGVGEKDSNLTFLPFAHILARVEYLGNIYAGYQLNIAESVDKVRFNLQEVKPTFLIAVPRIFEKIYNGIVGQVEAQPAKKKLFDWALGVGKQVSHCKTQRRPVPLPILGQYILAKKLVFSKIKEKLGGRLRFAVSGGAPLSQDIAEFFHAADLLLLEAYGLTETTAAVTGNTPFDYEFGTVGKPFGDVEIKIADDGEILVKSGKVMREYFKNAEANNEVFTDDGYFATGDIGEFTERGFLKITDRKKDLIKTAGGKYVAPQKLENLLKLNKFVSNVLIHGDKKKYIVALITLDKEAVVEHAKKQQISFSDYEALTQNPKIREAVREAVADANAKLASFETIKNFSVLNDDFTIEAGELTPSLKVKRKYCDNKYSGEIEKLYGLDASAM